MRESLAEPRDLNPTDPRSGSSEDIADVPELSDWLARHSDLVADFWFREVRRRSVASDAAVETLLREFIDFLASLVPASVRVHQTPDLDVWKRSAALYGQFGAIRGLAAGEVVEEFQVLRDAILRLVFKEPPVMIGADIKLREALRINRFVDHGVTQASVGHTDTLFFQLLEGHGVPEAPTPELLDEIRTQLATVRYESELIGA